MTELQTAESVKIWDLDGTAIDSRVVFDRLMMEVMPRFGFDAPTAEAIDANYHGSLAASIKGLLGKSADDALVLQVELAFLDAQTNAYDDIEPHFFPDAIELARRASQKGAAQIVVTSRNHESRGTASPRSIMERSQFGAYITAVICGDDSPYMKPDPKVLGQYEGALVGKRVQIIGDQYVDMLLAGNLRRTLGSAVTGVLVHRGGDLPPHMDRLDSDWRDYVTVVSSLSDVAA